MATPPEMSERHSRILGRLSEIGLAAVENLHARLEATEDDQAAAALAMALHRLSRSVRQTLALEAKLERDRQRDLVAETERATQRDEAARKHRKTQVNAAIDRLIWSEAEKDETFDAEGLSFDLLTRIDEAELEDDFLDAPIETVIARICGDLGLTPPLPSPLVGEGVGLRPDG